MTCLCAILADPLWKHRTENNTPAIIIVSYHVDNCILTLGIKANYRHSDKTETEPEYTAYTGKKFAEKIQTLNPKNTNITHNTSIEMSKV